MGKPAMSVANTTKHLTLLEKSTRLEAENALSRDRVKLSPPRWLKKRPAALVYWKSIIKKMREITLLDDVDADMLAVYCDGLARREELQLAMYREDGSIDEVVLKSLQAQERIIVQYADKLGLTPNGRVRLAKKRAEERQVDPNAELFE